ncbi:MAG: hypothetical protein HY778_08215 [Betaproteobacteria bacterium]|nr:hypothetical protein [Betaproteobacteria bacterium]
MTACPDIVFHFRIMSANRRKKLERMAGGQPGHGVTTARRLLVASLVGLAMAASAADAWAQRSWRGERNPQGLRDDRPFLSGRGEHRGNLDDRSGAEMRRLSPEERHQLRRDVIEANREFYRDRPLRRR